VIWVPRARYATYGTESAYLARGTQITGRAVLSGALVGLLVAGFMCGLGLTVSALARTNRVALSVSLFVLLATFVPTQMPSSAQHGTFGEALQRVDPVTAGLHYLSELVVAGHGPARDLDWLVGPFALAGIFAVSTAVLAARLRLLSGGWS